jgi:hypothetical protein
MEALTSGSERLDILSGEERKKQLLFYPAFVKRVIGSIL